MKFGKKNEGQEAPAPSKVEMAVEMDDSTSSDINFRDWQNNTDPMVASTAFLN